MNKIIVSLLSLVIVTTMTTYANAEMRSSGAIATQLKESTFLVKIKEGFHLNEKAPNSLYIDDKTIKPSKISARECEFTDLPKDWKKGRASLYVCDDAVTFCETHSIELNGGSSKSSQAKSSNPRKGKTNSQGFIEDDLNQALEIAKKQNKLVLADFSARWCPGCVRFEKETFDTKEFKSLTSNFVKVKLDVDRFENVILSEKFKINAIPTLLVMNAEQEEVNRLIDYQPNQIVNTFFTSIKANPATLKALIEKSKTKDAKLDLQLGLRLVDAGRYKESLEFLGRVQPAPVELAYAKVEAMGADYKTNKDLKTQYIKTLQAAIEAEPSSSRSITWRTTLIGLIDDKAQIKKIMTEGATLADFLISDPEKLKIATQGDLIGEFTGYEAFFVALNTADLVETAEAEPELIKKTWAKTAEVGKTLKISASQPGPGLRYLIVLSAASLFEDADKFSAEMLKHDPNNGDVQRRRVKVLNALKKYDEAIKLGQKAIKNSYGRNEFWVAELLAKAYVATQKNKEAKALIDSYLSRSDVEWANLQSSRKALEDLRVQLK